MDLTVLVDCFHRIYRLASAPPFRHPCPSTQTLVHHPFAFWTDCYCLVVRHCCDVLFSMVHSVDCGFCFGSLAFSVDFGDGLWNVNHFVVCHRVCYDQSDLLILTWIGCDDYGDDYSNASDFWNAIYDVCFCLETMNDAAKWIDSFCREMFCLWTDFDSIDFSIALRVWQNVSDFGCDCCYCRCCCCFANVLLSSGIHFWTHFCRDLTPFQSVICINV